MGWKKWLFLIIVVLIAEYLVILLVKGLQENPTTYNQTAFLISSFLQGADWSTLIAILALVVSIISLLNDRQSTSLNNQMYNDMQEEKKQNRLVLSIEEAFKDMNPDLPEDLWGLKIIVSNRGQEIPLFNGMAIKLIYRRKIGLFDWQHILYRLLGGEEILAYKIYYGYAGLRNGVVDVEQKLVAPYPERVHYVNDEEFANKSVYLVNWENKEDINFGLRTDRMQYRGPDPGKKEIWMLYGYLPESWRTELGKDSDMDMVLRELQVTIWTDLGEYQLQRGLADYSLLSSEFRTLLDDTAQRLKEKLMEQHGELSSLF